MDYMKEEFLQTLMDEVMRIRSGNPERVVELCLDIIEHSEGDYMYGKAFGEYYYAEACYRLNRPDQLVDHAIKGLTIQKKHDFYELQARTYNLMGAYFVTTGDLQNGLAHYLKGVEVASKHKMSHLLKVYYNNFGDLYLRLRDYNNAIYYFNKTNMLVEEHCSMCKSELEEEFNSMRWSNLVEAYLRLGQYENAKCACEELLSSISERYYKNNTALFYSVLSRLNYALGKRDQGYSSVKLFFRCIEERADLNLVSDAYFPMLELLLDEGLLSDAQCLLEYLTSIESGFRAQYQHVELCRQYVEYYKKIDDKERLFQAYESYYQAHIAFGHAVRKEKQKNMQIQIELHEAVKIQQDMLEQNEELKHMSEHDALTGLANRYSMNKYCEQMFEQACTEQLTFGVILVDIDYFKEYNDTYGHIEGDRCICAVANEIQKVTDDLLTARFGGDEFLVMGLNCCDEYLETIANRIRDGICNLHIQHDTSYIECYVTVSQGIVNTIPTNNDTVYDYIHMADIALYQVKKSRRNAYGFYHE